MSVSKYLLSIMAAGALASSIASPAKAELCFLPWLDDGETQPCDNNPDDISSCEVTTTTSGTTFSTTVKALTGFSASARPVNRFGDDFANIACESRDENPDDEEPGPTRNCGPDDGEPAVEVRVTC